MEFINGGITTPKGFTASGVYCGLRKNKTKKDLGLIFCQTSCNTVAVYTTNIVKGAPIAVTKKHLENNSARAIIVNSGNANTCNADGYEKAIKMCQVVSEKLKINPSDVVIASTGVIGQPLDIEAIERGIPSLVENLSVDRACDVAEAILTTDTVKKEFAIKFEIDGKYTTIACIAKGSGMINPNMATLLAFLTTDINISKELLDVAFREAVNYSLNRVSVDGDTSTNDMACIMASGLAENKLITSNDENYYKFLEALKLILLEISKLIARDGEGATKLIICDVINAKNEEDATKLSKAVIMSNLVKAAMFGNDANWGRILCALGYSKVSFDETKVDVDFVSRHGTINICKNGSSVEFSEELAFRIIDCDEVKILVNMNSGTSSAFAFGCDLTYDYVKINGSYRT